MIAPANLPNQANPQSTGNSASSKTSGHKRPRPLVHFQRLTEIVGRNMLGDDEFHLSVDKSSLARPYSDSNLVHGARLGICCMSRSAARSSPSIHAKTTRRRMAICFGQRNRRKAVPAMRPAHGAVQPAPKSETPEHRSIMRSDANE